MVLTLNSYLKHETMYFVVTKLFKWKILLDIGLAAALLLSRPEVNGAAEPYQSDCQAAWATLHDSERCW